VSEQRNGRTRQERRNADDLKARRLQPCRRCGQLINYDADPRTDPDAFNAGHIKAWKTHPELREDPANLQPEHANCGKAAHTRDGDDNGLGVVSTDW
jgi:hypothetical protein